MTRLYKKYYKRSTFLLDGIWKLKIDPEKKGFQEEWFSEVPEGCISTAVPSCWNHEPGLLQYEGLAWYFKEFRIESSNINIAFSGVTGEASIYLDGKLIGSHYGSFTGFSFTASGLEKGYHRLSIAVNNTHNSEDTIPLSKVDWFHYGGIIRSIEVMELGEVFIDSVLIKYELHNNYTYADLDFYLNLKSFNNVVCERLLKIYFEDRLIHTGVIKIEGEKRIEIHYEGLDEFSLWDTQNPHLYSFRFEIEEDDIIERTGFRSITSSKGEILLNGKKIYLNGINRHEDHPEWGFALPLKLMKRDIDLIKDLGCNAIRGSHYPNAEIFLDLCDEEGILFWEEIPLWQYYENHFRNTLLCERALKMLEEMIIRDYNHPGIVIWGLHNEIDTRIPSCIEFTEMLNKKAREIDSSRLITFATTYPLDDICLSYTDVISINMYIGWYDDYEYDTWEEFLSAMKAKLEKEGIADKPVFMSEFGAGAIYGVRDDASVKWSEDYQKNFIGKALQSFKKTQWISGTFIWQFCDIRSSQELELFRPRSFNNKGILNEYRKPKLAYEKVKEIYHKI